VTRPDSVAFFSAKNNTMDDICPKISYCNERDAYYQAGHAVVALVESLDVVRIFIEDDGSSWIDVQYPVLSRSRLNVSAQARSNARAVIRALLAGPAAQSRYSFGTCPADHPSSDFDLAKSGMMEHEAVWRAISLAGMISSDGPMLIRSMWRRVDRLIQGDEVWPSIEAVAKSLLITGDLTGSEVREIARRDEWKGSRAGLITRCKSDRYRMGC
jgi:hypothetical protein